MANNRKKFTRNGRYDATEGGALCGHPRRSRPGLFCRRQAGFNTEHPGQGRCHLHRGNNQGAKIRKKKGTADSSKIKVHPYDAIMHHSLADKWRQLSQSDYDALDLLPEAHLLRALIVDFVNRYEKMSEALLLWYAKKSDTKPRRVMDIADAYRMVDSLGKLIERVHKIRQEGAITLETFRRVVEAMGMIVAKHVPDADTLGSIEREWNTLAIDARRPDPTPPNEGEDDEEWES